MLSDEIQQLLDVPSVLLASPIFTPSSFQNSKAAVFCLLMSPMYCVADEHENLQAAKIFFSSSSSFPSTSELKKREKKSLASKQLSQAATPAKPSRAADLSISVGLSNFFFPIPIDSVHRPPRLDFPIGIFQHRSELFRPVGLKPFRPALDPSQTPINPAVDRYADQFSHSTDHLVSIQSPFNLAVAQPDADQRRCSSAPRSTTLRPIVTVDLYPSPLTQPAVDRSPTTTLHLDSPPPLGGSPTSSEPSPALRL
ncbi:hypothetical protein M0R45_008736 [Rubus argutus]|uniref:Uncharacterized protein n=1 Tax=Rubus argutus TaxID=59490 RepID=A0AAW1Y2L3_RUBAR